MSKKNNDKLQEKEFDTVTTHREIKEKIANEIFGVQFEQIKEYLKINSM